MDTITFADELLQGHLKRSNIDQGHGILHARAVLGHVQLALDQEDLPESQQLIIKLAALLHDADDIKFFESSKNYQYARAIAHEALRIENRTRSSCTKDTEAVIELISLVSASKNHNDGVPEGDEWKLLPRDADRLEAIGEVGIARCYIYTRDRNRNLFTDETERCKTEEELEEVATAERFSKYPGGSASMIDHFYDKVLHIHKMGSLNSYMEQVAKERKQRMIDFCLEFGERGSVDVDYLEGLVDIYGEH